MDKLRALKKEGIPTQEEYHKIDKTMQHIEQELYKMKIFQSIKEKGANIFNLTNPVREEEVLDYIQNSKLANDTEEAQIFYELFSPNSPSRWDSYIDSIIRYKTFFDDIVAVGATIQHFLYYLQ